MVDINANGVRHSFGKSLQPEEEAYSVNSWSARMGHCMGQIEDGLKCMYSEQGPKKGLNGKERKGKSARRDKKDVRWYW